MGIMEFSALVNSVLCTGFSSGALDIYGIYD